MGTIRQANPSESTFGSDDFDANNRTVGLTSSQNSTMRIEMEPHIHAPYKTEYDEEKPWVPKGTKH